MIKMLAGVFVLLAAVGGFKYSQIRAAMAGGGWQAAPEAVTTLVADAQEWEATLAAIGSVEAVNGVVVSADLPGVVASIEFESGKAVGKGDVLLRLDSSQEEAQLAAAEAKLELAKADLARYEGLVETGIVPRSTYDRAIAEARSTEASANEIRATIARKVIRAPFSGVLGIRQVNLGEYLDAGSPIVPLQALQPILVNVSVPQQELGRVRVGAEIRVVDDHSPDIHTGTVTAIDSMIDEATRNVRIQATLDNREKHLKPGMFVKAQIVFGAGERVIAVPASAISYAPFGDSVFIVESMKGADGKPYRGVRQQFVKLGGARGDQVAVVSGLKEGEEVVTSGVFKLRNGAAVQVNNDKKPANELKPKPEDS
jgi:membrane fusion protein (multidrug efflux system)